MKKGTNRYEAVTTINLKLMKYYNLLSYRNAEISAMYNI